MKSFKKSHAATAGFSASPIPANGSSNTLQSISGKVNDADSGIADSIGTQVRAYIPSIGFVRLSQIIGNPKVDPPIPGIIPISRSGWWDGVKKGIYPKGIKLSPRVTVWEAHAIVQLVADLARGEK